MSVDRLFVGLLGGKLGEAQKRITQLEAQLAEALAGSKENEEAWRVRADWNQKLEAENAELRKANANLHNLSPDMRHRGYECDCETCAELRKDRARLDWLSTPKSETCLYQSPVGFVLIPDSHHANHDNPDATNSGYFVAPTCREAIDSAMKDSGQ